MDIEIRLSFSYPKAKGIIQSRTANRVVTLGRSEASSTVVYKIPCHVQ